MNTLKKKLVSLSFTDYILTTEETNKLKYLATKCFEYDQDPNNRPRPWLTTKKNLLLSSLLKEKTDEEILKKPKYPKGITASAPNEITFFKIGDGSQNRASWVAYLIAFVLIGLNFAKIKFYEACPKVKMKIQIEE